MPADLGSAAPYARLMSPSAEGESGVDAEVTWPAPTEEGALAASGSGDVLVDVTEWWRSEAGVERRKVMTAAFGMPEGRLRSCAWGDGAAGDPAPGLVELLLAVEGLRLVNSD